MEPEDVREVAPAVLASLQRGLHEVVRRPIRCTTALPRLRLPEFEPMLRLPEHSTWIPVPGICSGLDGWREGVDSEPHPVVESRCRVVGGFGQRHLVSASGATLVDEGVCPG